MTLTFSIGTDYTLGYVSSSGTLTAVDQTDIDSGNDSAAENTTVIPYEVDIEVTISDSPDPVEAGANGGSNNLVHTIT
ncbi:MAG: hypothetical protein KC421_11525, partial [Anaerolineales bacterium]|nr:hypothetical protein [Anaerolineales bacterium]